MNSPAAEGHGIALSDATSSSIAPSNLQAHSSERPKFLSESDYRTLFERVKRAVTPGGETTMYCWSMWSGNIRWARNIVSSAGEVRDNYMFVDRRINGAQGLFGISNDLSEAGLAALVRHAERIALRRREKGSWDEIIARHKVEPPAHPSIFSDATYQLDATKRAHAARQLAQRAAAKGLMSAGYVQVAAYSLARFDVFGQVSYTALTHAQYSVTVRDARGSGSGWGGDSHWDWTKLDPDKLTDVAIEKCIASQNPSRLEPGQYTTILEPQAAAEIMGLVAGACLRDINEDCLAVTGPFQKSVCFSRLGERVIDQRLTFGTDPNDTELGYSPINFTWGADTDDNPITYRTITWIKQGVLEKLSYPHRYAVSNFHENIAYPNPAISPNAGSYRVGVTGPMATIDEMIATTQRGLLVTRFDQVQLLNPGSLLARGYTRDGLWLIESGKITKPVTNFQFTQPVLGALNNVEQIGVPTRVFRPTSSIFVLPSPVIVPAVKIRDFKFTSLSDSV